MNISIPFNRPSFEGRERLYMEQALANGHISGEGSFTKRCHELLEQELGVRKVLLTTSCTHALEMAALLLDLKRGDEVIVPSFTFVSTINAFVMHGGRPVFIDIRRDTLNMDEAQLPALITARTRAIVPVHYAGVGCAMQEILRVAGSSGIEVIEDNAHGLFGKYGGRYLGTFGALATQSFHETKNFTCGEGGALLINDEKYIERSEIIREKGTNRSRFFRGLVDKYTWVDLGSSYLPSDILAAFLCAQLERRDEIQSARRKIWQFYDEHLREWAADHGIGLPIVPSGCEQSYHMFFLITPSVAWRQKLMDHLKGKGILSVFHYMPLHRSEMARRTGASGECPVTEEISDRILRLPFYTSMTTEAQAYVVEAIREFE